MVAEHRRYTQTPQLEQFSNSYFNEGLNMWSNSYKFAERMYDYTSYTSSIPYTPHTPYIPYTHVNNNLYDCYIGIHDSL